ncbi:MAG: hypothetical protein QXE74_08990 [Candidatus Bathyarchaeia archaeon]
MNELILLFLVVVLGLIYMLLQQQESTQQSSNSHHGVSPPLLVTQPPLRFRLEYVRPNFPMQDSFSNIQRRGAWFEFNRQGWATRSSMSQQHQPFSKNIVENWRKSIVGLIKLAESNLKLAKSHLATQNYRGAVNAAITSVENISRALLHGFGEKPDPSLGQEEPLMMVARRLRGEERARFERMVKEAAKICRNKISEELPLEHDTSTLLLAEGKARRIVTAATNVVNEFKRIIQEHFGTEIAELSEKCPKCQSLTISVWAFNQHGTNYQCEICGHKWIQPPSE